MFKRAGVRVQIKAMSKSCTCTSCITQKVKLNFNPPLHKEHTD